VTESAEPLKLTLVSMKCA